MGPCECSSEVVTVSEGGVTVHKECLEDEYAVPTIRLVLENDTHEGKTVEITETVPDGFSVKSIGFHPEYGAARWTRYADDRATFERELPPSTGCETIYGIEVDAPEEAAAFMTEPRLVVDGDAGDDTDGDRGADSDDSLELSDEELVTELFEEEDGGTDAAVAGDVEFEDDSDGDGQTGGRVEPDQTGADQSVDSDASDDQSTDASLDVEIPGELPTAGDLAVTVEESDVESGDDGTDLEIELSSPTGGAGEHPPAGPETGSVVERLVAELERNDVDAEQRKILRDQLDLGVPSTIRARLNQLSNRVETIAAYADALEEFLDEDGTAQEVIDDFETQVSALREDVATMREEAATNASEISSVGDDLGALETRVSDLEGSFESVADRVDDVEDSLSTTETQIEAVAGDLRQTECQVAENVEAIDELDRNLADVEGDLSDVETRVSSTEEAVDDLDETAASLRTDLDDVAGSVADVEARTDDHAEAIDSIEEYAGTLEADIGAVEGDVADLCEWRDELGEMFK